MGERKEQGKPFKILVDALNPCAAKADVEQANFLQNEKALPVTLRITGELCAPPLSMHTVGGYISQGEGLIVSFDPCSFQLGMH